MIQGERGIQGEKGEPGNWASRKVTASFWIIVVVAALLVGYLGYQQKQSRNLGRENEARIIENQELVDDLVELQRNTNNRFAASDAKQIATLRTLICFGANQVATSKQRTAEEKEMAADYYTQMLAIIDAPPCEA